MQSQLVRPRGIVPLDNRLEIMGFFSARGLERERDREKGASERLESGVPSSSQNIVADFASASFLGVDVQKMRCNDVGGRVRHFLHFGRGSHRFSGSYHPVRVTRLGHGMRMTPGIQVSEKFSALR